MGAFGGGVAGSVGNAPAVWIHGAVAEAVAGGVVGAVDVVDGGGVADFVADVDGVGDMVDAEAVAGATLAESIGIGVDLVAGVHRAVEFVAEEIAGVVVIVVATSK